MIISKEAIKLAFPWCSKFQEILEGLRPVPIAGSHLLVGSDYSGSHRQSSYLVYCFLVVDAEASWQWPQLRKTWRDSFLASGRRMSFKALNDNLRRRALVPFLEAAEYLVGHCVVIVIHKKIRYLSSNPRALEIWRSIQGLEGRWEPQAFEAVARVSRLFSLIISALSSPLQYVTWITDEDEIVANDSRLTDALNLASKFSGLYLRHRLGEFAMNTTKVDAGDYRLEDFVALSDLAAGAFSEIVTTWARQPGWGEGGDLKLDPRRLSDKANVISSWLSFPSADLQKTAILVDRYNEQSFRVVHLDITR